MGGTILKKGITLIGVLAAVLAITSGAFATNHYLVTSSKQIKNGVVSVSDLSPAARKALLGKKTTGSAGPQGLSRAQCPQGSEGDTRATGAAGKDGTSGKDGARGNDGAPGKNGVPGFSPTAFGPYASDSPDSSIC